MKIPIYHRKYNCYRCKKEMEIYYPEGLAYKHGLGNLKKVYSKTMERETIGNICPHCSAYQGNWFIWKDFLGHVYDDDFLDFLVWVEGDLKCSDCGGNIDYKIPNDREKIWDFLSGYFGDLCYSCIMEENVKTLIYELNESLCCAICNRIILNDDWNYYQGLILDEKNIVFSKPIQHHINYVKDEIITVCESCHTKIHFSNDPNYTRYKPPDERPEKKRKYILVPCSGNGCDQKAKILKSGYEEGKKYLCYKCKRELKKHEKRWLETIEKARLRDWKIKHGF